jgi:hypothetical protein
MEESGDSCRTFSDGFFIDFSEILTLEFSKFLALRFPVSADNYYKQSLISLTSAASK